MVVCPFVLFLLANFVLSVFLQFPLFVLLYFFFWPLCCLSFFPVLSGVRVTRSLVLYVCFVDRGSCYSIFSFMCMFCTVVCPFVLFLLAIVLSVLLRFRSFCPFSFGHCVVCSSIYGAICTFFFWPLFCLFFFDIRILITPLVSSNSS